VVRLKACGISPACFIWTVRCPVATSVRVFVERQKFPVVVRAAVEETTVLFREIPRNGTRGEEIRQNAAISTCPPHPPPPPPLHLSPLARSRSDSCWRPRESKSCSGMILIYYVSARARRDPSATCVCGLFCRCMYNSVMRAGVGERWNFSHWNRRHCCFEELKFFLLLHLQPLQQCVKMVLNFSTFDHNSKNIQNYLSIFGGASWKDGSNFITRRSVSRKKKKKYHCKVNIFFSTLRI